MNRCLLVVAATAGACLPWPSHAQWRCEILEHGVFEEREEWQPLGVDFGERGKKEQKLRAEFRARLLERVPERQLEFDDAYLETGRYRMLVVTSTSWCSRPSASRPAWGACSECAFITSGDASASDIGDADDEDPTVESVTRIDYPAGARLSPGLEAAREWSGPAPIGKPWWTGWHFEREEELLPGTWIVHLVRDGRVVCSQAFAVTVP